MINAPRMVASRDGTLIAVFSSGDAAVDTRPLILVHGTASDHLTFRIAGPLLALRRRIHAIDRRGRGASGDAPDGYAIEHEFEDVVAVADAVAADNGSTVDVLGHSFGGRCALGAALLTRSIRRIVCYEGAPPRDLDAASAYEPAWLMAALRDDLARGDLEALLEQFMRTVVRFDDDAMARFRADPVWPLRVASAATILRELSASNDPAAGLERMARVTAPVLQVLGTTSPPAFAANVAALNARLPDGRIVAIEGAAHAAHHSHPDAFVPAVETFLDAPLDPPRD